MIQEKQEIHIALGKQLSYFKVQEKMIEDAITVLGLEKEKPHLWTETELKNLKVFFAETYQAHADSLQ